MDREQATGAERANLSTGAGRRASWTASRARGIGFGLAAAIALCCTLLAPPTASATGTGSISGKITVAGSGSGAEGAQACASNREGRGECAYANAGGEYTIEELEAGEYTVEFTGEACEGACHPYVRQFYEDASEYEHATPVVLSTGQKRGGIDAVLELGAAIEGEVRSEGKPVANVVVCAIGESEQECTATNGGGDYKIEGLAAGEYRVEFNGTVCVANTCKHTYVEQFYEDAPEYSSARPLTLQAGETVPGIDATLELADSIAGTVDGTGGTPIANTEVCARRAGVYSSQNCTDTKPSGQYEIEGLSEGEYTVFFTGEVCEGDSCTQHYLFQYYAEGAGVYYESEATRVQLTGHGSNAAEIDATLEAAASIAGTVYGPGGALVSDTRVCAESPALDAYGCAETNADGEYEIEGLRAGQYTVEFSGEVCPEGGGEAECSYPYAEQYYDGVSERGGAEPVSLTGGQKREDIDATLALGGQIDGTVTIAALDKAPVAGIQVCAFAPHRSIERCTQTQSSGDYAIEGLESGSYTVEFEGEICGENGCAEEYLPQYYEGSTEEADAKAVEVHAPAAVTGIDASMSEAKPKTPVALVAPTLTGSATVGATLQCSEGSFSNNPTRLAYEWLRDGAPIPGASASSYVVQEADEGHALACEATAFNAAGSSSARSNTLAIPAKPGPGPAPEVVAHGSAVARGTATEKKGRVLLQLICTGSGPCSGEVVLVASVRQKRGKHHKSKVEKLTIGKASFSLPAGAKQTLAVKLTAKGKALIAGAGKHGATVQLSGSDLASRVLIVKASSEKKKKKKKTKTKTKTKKG